MTVATVLLILDNEKDISMYGSALTSAGYKVLIPQSYSDGIDTLARERIDLVIVGQGTEEFEALRVLGVAAERQPRPPVLVVTRQMDLHCFMDALDMGAADYLENPELPDLLWTVAGQMRPIN